MDEISKLEFALNSSNNTIERFEKKILEEAAEALKVINVAQSAEKRNEAAACLEMLARFHSDLEYKNQVKLRSICAEAARLYQYPEKRNGKLSSLEGTKREPEAFPSAEELASLLEKILHAQIEERPGLQEKFATILDESRNATPAASEAELKRLSELEVELEIVLLIPARHAFQDSQERMFERLEKIAPIRPKRAMMLESNEDGTYRYYSYDYDGNKFLVDKNTRERL